MDDNQTHQTLESLADIYLTNAARTPIIGAGLPGGTLPGSLPGPHPGADPMRIRPVRMGPKIASVTAVPLTPSSFQGRLTGSPMDNVPVAPPSQSASFVDDANDLNVYDATAHAPAPAPAPGSHAASHAASRPGAVIHENRSTFPGEPTVETVFLGNLPGFGAAWLSQYAHMKAVRTGKNIGLLRMNEQSVEVQIFRPRVGGAELAIRRDFYGDSINELLEQLAEEGDLHVDAFLVHPGALNYPAALARARQIPGRWTLVSGADEAAISSAVGAFYRWAQLQNQKRPLGLMIVGSDEARSTQAHQQIHQQLGLAFPLEFVGFQKQMQPVDSQDLGSFESPRLESQVVSYLVEFEMNRQSSETNEAAGSTSATTTPASKADLSVANASSSSDTSAISNQQSSISSTVVHEEKESVAHASGSSASATSSISSLDLSVFLRATGIAGSLLAARSPRHGSVQLLLDGAGALHLLRAQQEKEDLRQTLAELLEVKAWVVEHIALLQLTAPQGSWNLQAQPTIHLFTSQAKSAVALVTGLGSLVKLHLLQSVQLAGQTAWVSSELN